MIYTVTLNPSLDYIVQCHSFTIGATNRAEQETITAGGKGINVSRVLCNLGIPSVTIGFIAGFTGKEIDRQLQTYGLISDMIHLEEGCSRINLKLQAEEETELNGMGPSIPAESMKLLYQKLQNLREQDTLVLSGSIPQGMPSDLYQKIIQHVPGIPVIVDAAGGSLLCTLPEHPFLIKPNQSELEGLTHTVVKDWQDTIEPMRQLQRKGARNIITSLGKEGATFLTEDGHVFHATVECENAVNTVDAGDSMIAGFLSGYMWKHDSSVSFREAVAFGSATAIQIGFADRKDVEAMLPHVRVDSVI